MIRERKAVRSVDEAKELHVLHTHHATRARMTTAATRAAHSTLGRSDSTRGAEVLLDADPFLPVAVRGRNHSRLAFLVGRPSSTLGQRFAGARPRALAADRLGNPGAVR